MELPQKRSERIAALILIGLFLGVSAVVGIGFYLANRKADEIPLKDALWVTDWNIEEIHGPGSLQQERILIQLNGPEWTKLKFTAPVLYRIPEGVPHPSEGLLLYGFDPDHPEMALALKHRP
jgi:hypothetical protein